MFQVQASVCALMFFLLAAFSAPVYAKLSLSDKVRLQSAMQQHVEKSLVDGNFLHLDASSGVIRSLQQDDAHPMIIRMGKYFVLCAEFSDGDGEPVNVDFFVAADDGNFVVFQSLVDDRRVLHQLMKNGDAVRVD